MNAFPLQRACLAVLLAACFDVGPARAVAQGDDLHDQPEEFRLADAIRHHKIGEAMLLIDKGANLDGSGSIPCALAAATLADDLAMIRVLLSHGANVNCNDGLGGTPLLNTFFLGTHLDAARLLVQSGANVNVPAPRRRFPILADAVGAYFIGSLRYRQELREFIDLLLQHGANPNVAPMDSDGAITLELSPLRRAMFECDMTMSAQFINAGGDPLSIIAREPDMIERCAAIQNLVPDHRFLKFSCDFPDGDSGVLGGATLYAIDEEATHLDVFALFPPRPGQASHDCEARVDFDHGTDRDERQGARMQPEAGGYRIDLRAMKPSAGCEGNAGLPAEITMDGTAGLCQVLWR